MKDSHPSPLAQEKKLGESSGWIAGAIVILIIIAGLFYWGGSTKSESKPRIAPISLGACESADEGDAVALKCGEAKYTYKKVAD